MKETAHRSLNIYSLDRKPSPSLKKIIESPFYTNELNIACPSTQGSSPRYIGP